MITCYTFGRMAVGYVTQHNGVQSNISELFGIANLGAKRKDQPLAGLEPAIPCLGGRCLIHLATEAMLSLLQNYGYKTLQ